MNFLKEAVFSHESDELMIFPVRKSIRWVHVFDVRLAIAG